jgi:hypothetical protein
MFVKEKVWKSTNQLESVAALIGVSSSRSMFRVQSSEFRVQSAEFRTYNSRGDSLKTGEHSRDANPSNFQRALGLGSEFS